MKRILALLFTSLVLLLCVSCGENEPTKGTIKEMNYEINQPMTEITDIDVIAEEMIDTGAFDSREAFDSSIMDIRYYESDDFTLAISAMQAYYVNSDIDTVIKETYVEDVSNSAYFKKFDANGYEGRIGYEEKESYNNHMVFALKDGIVYLFEASIPTASERHGLRKILDIIDPPVDGDEFMSYIAEHITFSDGRLDNFSVNYKNMTFDLPENAYKTKVTKSNDTTLKKEKRYAIFKDGRTNIASCYMQAEFSIPVIKNILEDFSTKTETKTINGSKIVCGTGKSDDTHIYSIAFSKSGRFYMIDIETKGSQEQNNNIGDDILATLEIK